MKRYKTIFIDWAGTLSTSKFWGQWENPSHPQYPLFSKTQEFIIHPSQFMTEWMRGEHTSEEYVDYVAKEIGHDFDELFEEFVKSSQHLQFISEEIINLVKAHQSHGTQVIIATDNMDCFSRWTIPALKLDKHFDEILNSYHLNVLKGDTDKNGKSLFFTDYLKRHKIREEESVLIDNSQTIESVAKASGIRFLPVTQTNNVVLHLKNLLV